MSNWMRMIHIKSVMRIIHIKSVMRIIHIKSVRSIIDRVDLERWSRPLTVPCTRPLGGTLARP